MLAARHHTTRAYLALRKGDETAALEHVERTNSIIRALPPIVAIMPRSVQLVHLFRFRGASALEKAIADNQFSPNEPVARVLTAHAMLAQGAFADLADYAHEHLPSMRDPQYRRILLSALTAGAAFQRLPKEAPPWAAARAELALVESGSQSDSLLPIASAWLIPLAQHEPARAKKLLAESLARAAGPVDQSVLMTPIVLVLAAQALAERDALKRIADGAIWSGACEARCDLSVRVVASVAIL
jgi:hypothetical protein